MGDAAWKRSALDSGACTDLADSAVTGWDDKGRASESGEKEGRVVCGGWRSCLPDNDCVWK